MDPTDGSKAFANDLPVEVKFDSFVFVILSDVFPIQRILGHFEHAPHHRLTQVAQRRSPQGIVGWHLRPVGEKGRPIGKKGRPKGRHALCHDGRNPVLKEQGRHGL